MDKRKRAALPVLCAASLALLATSCGEDRTWQYEELIAEDLWIKAEMDNIYLWKDDMPADDDLDFFQQCGRRTIVLKVDRPDLSAIRKHFPPFRNGMHVVITTLDINIRPAFPNDRLCRIFAERHDRADRFQCRKNRHPVFASIDRTIVALAEPSDRIIGIDGHHEGSAKGTRLFQIGHMPAMQNIEYAVRQHDRFRQTGNLRHDRGAVAYFFVKRSHPDILKNCLALQPTAEKHTCGLSKCLPSMPVMVSCHRFLFCTQVYYQTSLTL